MTDFTKIYRILILILNNTIPYFIRIRINAENFGIVEFMEFASKTVKSSDRVLDAGAGSCPYKKYFSHAKYESTDFEGMFEGSYKDRMDFICSLEEIPRSENSYDVIIATQVLEHVEYPQKVINEFYRILKSGGKLFLTAPQGWGIHGAPYNFFNFTNYGLESLFRNAGLEIIFIEPRGGIFWYLGNRIRTLPFYILYQYLFKRNDSAVEFKPEFLAFILFPFYLLSIFFCCFLIPLLFFYLDKLDKKRDYTLGYACYCIKN